jgi:hypothetical protein
MTRARCASHVQGLSMGDMAEDFGALKEAGREKRRYNAASSTAFLKEQHIPFEPHNNGAHLVVAGIVDFWPSTGLWIPRDKKHKRGRGVFKLVRFVRWQRSLQKKSKPGEQDESVQQ